MVSRRTLLKGIIAVSVISAVSTIYPMYIETNYITTTELEIDLGLGLKAIQISDTHFASSNFDPNKIIDTIKSYSPDIIFHTGDVITYLDGFEDAVEFIGKLSEISPIYIVAGNHDHWSGLGSKGLKENLEKIGEVYVLNNEAKLYDKLWVVGVDDPYTYHDDIDKAMKNIHGGYPVVLLAHSPQIIDKVNSRIGLVLAGHTHGGQVRLPFIGAIHVPLPSKYRKYDYGLFEVKATYMFVTRGIGTSFFPIRFNCPPEVVVINL